MSYHIYTTKGLVLAERPIREADRIYTVLTRDLGLVHATALGVRNGSSKLRGNMEPFSLVSLSLIRGKDHWRVTSAESIQRISSSPNVVRPLALVEKLVQGEAPHPELFDVVEEAALSSQSNDEMSEIRLVSQILFHLGYLKKSDLDLDRQLLIGAINNGLQASHL
jgi:DNA repair protein RecO